MTISMITLKRQQKHIIDISIRGNLSFTQVQWPCYVSPSQKEFVLKRNISV